MVFIPEGLHDPLWAAFKNGSDNWRDDGHNIYYTKGMQGCYLAEHNMTDGTRIAQIFIHRVTEWGRGPDEREAWVPYDEIKISPKWKSNLKD
ncbi:hypothetical protein G6011_08401 [Alternaria panax]|uniref:Uncharacterized protein n=1 Tax=Alternaria panax TaxID=48097 RepID=A0AAD4FHU0_9PLEO|nr:hypothetical protein G6011_08401 [Alternaria panax]